MRLAMACLLGAGTGCLASPPSTAGGDDDGDADSGIGGTACTRYRFEGEAGLIVHNSPGCAVEIEGSLHFMHDENVGCWVELDEQVALGPDGSIAVSYGDESDLSVDLQAYSSRGEVAVSRWGTTFELDWFQPGGSEPSEIQSIEYDASLRRWRMILGEDEVRVSAGPDDASLVELFSAEIPFDPGQVGVLVGAWDDRAEHLEASFDDLDVCP